MAAPLLGAGAVALSLALASCLNDGSPSGPGIAALDTLPPEIRIINPEPGEIPGDWVRVEAAAQDASGIDSVVFLLDGEVLGVALTAPFTCDWPAGFWADGQQHALAAAALDTHGNAAQSSTVAVSVPHGGSAVPTPLSPGPGEVVSAEEALILVWASQTTAGAVEYGVRLTRDAESTVLLATAASSESTVAVPDLPPGHAYWNVRARGACGRWGPWSPPRGFFLVGPSLTYEHRHSGAEDDMGLDACLTADDGLLVGGCFGDDAWLVQLDCGGLIRWDRMLVQSDYLPCLTVQVAAAPGGGFLAGGRGNGIKPFLARTDDQGDTIWSRVYAPTNAEDHFASFLAMRDGGYMIAGSYFADSPPDWPQGPWLIAAGEDGDVLWTRIDEGCVPSMLMEREDGSVVGFGTRGPSAMTSGGDLLWSENLSHAPGDLFLDGAPAADGGFILTGRTQSMTQDPADEQDMWLVKTDAAGAVQWERAFGGPAEDLAYSVTPTYDGGYLLAGKTASFGTGADDGIIIRTDCSGNEIWRRILGGDDADVFQAVLEHPMGDVIAVGGSNTESAGGYDLWVVRLAADGSGP